MFFLILFFSNYVNSLITTSTTFSANPYQSSIIINSTLTLNPNDDSYCGNDVDLFGFVIIGKNINEINRNLNNLEEKINCIYYMKCFNDKNNNIKTKKLDLVFDNNFIYQTCLGITNSNIISINYTIALGHAICKQSNWNDNNHCYDYGICGKGKKSIEIATLTNTLIVINNYKLSASNGLPSSTQILNTNNIQQTYSLTSQLSLCPNSPSFHLVENLFSILCYQMIISPFYIPLIYSSCSNPIFVSITDYFYSADALALKSPCFINTYTRNGIYDQLGIVSNITKLNGKYSTTIKFYVAIDANIIMSINSLVQDGTFSVVGNNVIFKSIQNVGIKYLYSFDSKSKSLICRGSDYMTYNQKNCNIQINIPVLTQLSSYNGIQTYFSASLSSEKVKKKSFFDTSYESSSTVDSGVSSNVLTSTLSGTDFNLNIPIFQIPAWSIATYSLIGFIMIGSIYFYYWHLKPLLQELRVLREMKEYLKNILIDKKFEN